MTSTPRFRAKCDSCLSGHGLPRAVKVGAQERSITYECDTCHEEWTVTETGYIDPVLDPFPTRPIKSE